MISGGEIYGIEHNAKLGREQWLGEPGTPGIVQQMKLSNPQIQAVMLALKLPIVSADWTVEPADYREIEGLTQDAAEEHAKTVRKGIFETPAHDWRDTVGESLLHLDYGFMLFEKAWTVLPDGTYAVDEFASRLPSTIRKWYTDPENGRFAGVEQQYYKPEVGLVTVDIDAANLILLTHGREGNNFAGVSIVRPLWAFAKVKEMLIKLLSLIAEREAMGLPTVNEPEGGATDGQIDQIENLLKNMMAHQKKYAILPHGFTLEWIYNQGSGQAIAAILDLIRYIDEQTLNAGLSQFIGLGSTATGSQGVAEEHTDLFWMVENGIAANIASGFNGVGRGQSSGVIRQLTVLNHGEQVAYPTLQAGSIEGSGLSDFADALQKMGTFVNQDDVMDEFIRAKLGAPARDPDAEVEVEPKEKAPPPEDKPETKPDDDEKQEDEIDAKMADSFAFVPKRDLTQPEKSVRFAEIMLRIDAAEDTAEDVISIVASAYADVSKRVNRAVASGSISKIPKRIKGLEAAIYEVVSAETDDALEFGRKTVASEKKRQERGAKPIRPSVRRFADTIDRAEYLKRLKLRREALEAQEAELAAEIAARAESKMRQEALGAIRRGEDALAVEAIVPSVQDIKRGTAGLTATAINLGRDEAAAAFGESLQAVQYSAVMDQNTCGPCADADTQIFPFNSPEHHAHECPYGQCEGGSLCRCILVYVFDLFGGK